MVWMESLRGFGENVGRKKEWRSGPTSRGRSRGPIDQPDLNSRIATCPRLLSFLVTHFSSACVAQSMASCCMSSDMSAFLITAFLSTIFLLLLPLNLDSGNNFLRMIDF
ncbi:hypothetical protein WR25_00810 [Diploscapter pachys]|uniref:Uncharacterized protein n=1 Tax=Diploscapter pachys TaxID=2018661 RepID=A0A2A2JKZ7_9BILA|nr:hypothetical protein WR25_00810 [Diploscapter pachys]